MPDGGDIGFVDVPRVDYYAVWTGYTYSMLMANPNETLLNILNTIDILVDGPFIESEKDLSLKLRGSRNQHIRVRRDNQWEIQDD